MTKRVRRVHLFMWFGADALQPEQLLCYHQAQTVDLLQHGAVVPMTQVITTETPAQAAQRLLQQELGEKTVYALLRKPKFFAVDHWLSRDDSKDLYATMLLPILKIDFLESSIQHLLNCAQAHALLRSSLTRHCASSHSFATTRQEFMPHIEEEFIPQSSAKKA